MKLLLQITFILIFFVSMICADEDIVSTDHLFETFARKHDKNYGTTAEKAFRAKIFNENVATINDLNRKYPHATFAINKYADYTDEEIKELYIQKEDFLRSCPPSDSKDYDKFDAEKQPESYDVCDSINCPPVGDKGDCNKGGYAIMSANLVACQLREGDLSIIVPSAQQFIDCKDENGCTTGSVGLSLEKNKKLMKESDYPWTGNADDDCRFKQKKTFVKTDGYESSSFRRRNRIKKDLVKNGAIVVSLDITNAYTAFTYYSGGVFTHNGCDMDRMRNVEIAVQPLLLGWGYDEDSQDYFWKLQLPMGTGWGENGYMKLNTRKDCALGKKLQGWMDTMFRAKNLRLAD